MLDLIYKLTLVLAGIAFACLAKLGYDYVTIGHGLHPAACIAVSIVLLISICIAELGTSAHSSE